MRAPSRSDACLRLALSDDDLPYLHRLWRICGLDTGLRGLALIERTVFRDAVALLRDDPQRS